MTEFKTHEAINAGRDLAKKTLLEMIDNEIRSKDSEEKVGGDVLFHDAYIAGLQVAKRLIEAQEPLTVWEVDCRKGRQQWSKRSTRTTKVYVDGTLLERCVAADSVAGKALRHVIDDHGNLCFNAAGIFTEVVEGKVELRSALT